MKARVLCGTAVSYKIAALVYQAQSESNGATEVAVKRCYEILLLPCWKVLLLEYSIAFLYIKKY